MKPKSQVKNLVLTALFIALALVLPTVFHIFGPDLSKVLSPMHIPVLLCGFVVGGPMGLLAGIITPLLGSVMNGMPPVLIAICMAVELGCYGFVSGYLFNKKKVNMLIALVCAIVIGRLAYGCAMSLVMLAQGSSYGFIAYLGSAFITGLPGIIIQMILVPLVVIILQKAHFIESNR